VNLFGEPDPPEPSCADPNVKPSRAKHPTVRRGYAAIPGTGPAGEKCGTCCHREIGYGGWYKCDLIRAHWTGGLGTDILLRSPACREWEPESSRANPALKTAGAPSKALQQTDSAKKTLTPGPDQG